MPRGRSRAPMVAVVVVLALAGGALLFLRGGTETEVVLEAVTFRGVDPFQPPVGVVDDEPPVRPVPDPGFVGTVGGREQPLYGGTGDLEACDKRGLVRFLERNPDKATAWAQVIGIDPAEIPGYIDDLIPTVLRTDRRVTNHGFRDGRPTAFHSILQTGTGVLIDAAGQPVVRCKCGNPLAPPARIAGPQRPVVPEGGRTWAAFRPEEVVAVEPIPEADLPVAIVPVAGSPPPEPTGDPPPANLLSNPGFESGLDGWGPPTAYPDPELFWGRADASATVDGSVARSGNASLRIENRTPYQPQVYRTLARMVSVSAGAEYCLRFWARGQNLGVPTSLTVTWERSWATRVSVPPGTFEWQEFTATFVAEADAIDIRIITENTGTVWLDDFSLATGPC